MADVASGIEVGGPAPVDPFAAALEAKGITGGGASTTASVADGLTYGDQTPEPAPADTSGDVIDDYQGDATDPEPLHDDPDVAAYLAKFDGDADKALKSAASAQALLGKQGNELGELRQTVAKLEGMVEASLARPAAVEPTVQMSADQLQEQYDEYGGLQLATWAANNAPHLVDNILAIWGADEPFPAIRFDREYSDWKRAQEAATATPPEPSRTDQYVAEQVEAARMTEAMDAVKVDFPNYDNFTEFLNDALDQSSGLVQQGVLSDDDAVQRDALKEVFARADALFLKSLSNDADEAAKARAAVSKQNARVIRGQAGTPAPPTGGQDAEDAEKQAQARLKAAILGASTTSVREGLTYGKA